MTKKIIRIVWMGAVIWLVPFVISFGFFDSTGKLTVTKELFKSVMLIVSSLTGAWMLYQYFKHISRDYYFEGVAIGCAWLIINWLLDVVILIPMSNMSLKVYFESIGLGYLQIPVICMTTGLLLQLKAKPMFLEN